MAKKKTREAAALSYDATKGAPKVVAAGSGYVAENIIAAAEEHGIPVHADPDLAHTLNLLGIGEEIPAELYDVVAQILLYVCDMDKLQNEWGPEP